MVIFQVFFFSFQEIDTTKILSVTLVRTLYMCKTKFLIESRTRYHKVQIFHLLLCITLLHTIIHRITL